jgi:2'-5' RNA ligase
MVNRWESRIEPEDGQGKLYWHILFGDDPKVRELAAMAQGKLAPFPGLHFTPQEWLHTTTLVVGFADEFTGFEISQMVAFAHGFLSGLSPITITFGKILYHPEAIAIGVRPKGALDPVHNAVWQATCNAIGSERILNDQPWNPHFTVAYSTTAQPASPIIGTLGRELPDCEATISSISLVIQEGAERLWNWRSIAEVPFGNCP